MKAYLFTAILDDEVVHKEILAGEDIDIDSLKKSAFEIVCSVKSIYAYISNREEPSEIDDDYREELEEQRNKRYENINKILEEIDNCEDSLEPIVSVWTVEEAVWDGLN